MALLQKESAQFTTKSTNAVRLDLVYDNVHDIEGEALNYFVNFVVDYYETNYCVNFVVRLSRIGTGECRSFALRHIQDVDIT